MAANTPRGRRTPVETIVVLLGAVDDFADVGSRDNLAGNINLDVPELPSRRGRDTQISFDLIVPWSDKKV